MNIKVRAWRMHPAVVEIHFHEIDGLEGHRGRLWMRDSSDGRNRKVWVRPSIRVQRWEGWKR